MPAAHEHRVGLPRHVEVVGVAALPLHQDRILGAAYRLADAVFVEIEGVRTVLDIHLQLTSGERKRSGALRLSRRPWASIGVGMGAAMRPTVGGPFHHARKKAAYCRDLD